MPSNGHFLVPKFYDFPSRELLRTFYMSERISLRCKASEIAFVAICVRSGYKMTVLKEQLVSR